MQSERSHRQPISMRIHGTWTEIPGHGKNGEDGAVQGLFKLAGIPIVGCGTLASALCMDKDRAHKLAATAGVKAPSTVMFDHLSAGREIMEKTRHISYLLFEKPVRSGSSIGITKVNKKNELAQGGCGHFFGDCNKFCV